MSIATSTNESIRLRSSQFFEFRLEHRDSRKKLYCVFSPEAIASASAFIQELIGPSRLKWLNRREAQVGSVVIRSDRLEDVLEFEGEAGSLSPETLYRLRSFLGTVSIKDKPPKLTGSVSEVPLDKLAREAGMKPGAARRVLRAHGLKPPGSRWVWNEAEAPHIRKLLASKN